MINSPEWHNLVSSLHRLSPVTEVLPDRSMRVKISFIETSISVLFLIPRMFLQIRTDGTFTAAIM